MIALFSPVVSCLIATEARAWYLRHWLSCLRLVRHPASRLISVSNKQATRRPNKALLGEKNPQKASLCLTYDETGHSACAAPAPAPPPTWTAFDVALKAERYRRGICAGCALRDDLTVLLSNGDAPKPELLPPELLPHLQTPPRRRLPPDQTGNWRAYSQ